MTQFSANLGFLWADRSLPDAIRAASAAGFDAVECHWPYDTPHDDVSAALSETGLPMLGLNTVRGKPGENGLSALPGREVEARAAIDQAIAYADAVDARAIHVMAGFAQGDDARQAFEANLSYAVDRTDRVILIEPLNRHDAPGYFLQTTDQAQKIIKAVDRPNLKLMFDCYHVGRTEGDVMTRLTNLLPFIGHIQFASVPDRGPPTAGELNYKTIFAHTKALGWTAPLGAEFKPQNTNENSDWLGTFQSKT
ncbi:TIM barrel protein [Tateyamaria sp. ANG-S1]|uniref:hydroxypyruvate isomerase family protein n=1 Tax=Tateyamaria sp. ANG-S1 TaxID=1577905 RepID=UPI00057CB217|nr:TIM barrel protein [Tateyamaria sp. ANG-S1]KIC48027.1 isomerase [Tateyamaria sp. ANG-S1]